MTQYVQMIFFNGSLFKFIPRINTPLPLTVSDLFTMKNFPIWDRKPFQCWDWIYSVSFVSYHGWEGPPLCLLPVLNHHLMRKILTPIMIPMLKWISYGKLHYVHITRMCQWKPSRYFIFIAIIAFLLQLYLCFFAISIY